MKGGIDEYNYIPSINGGEFTNMFKALANHYMRRFCRWNELDYKLARWENDEPGSRAIFDNGLVLTFDELRYAVENNIPLVIVEKWYDYSRRTKEAEDGIRKSEKFTTLPKIHLREWCEGKELPYTYRQLRRLKEKAKRHIAKYERIQNKHKGRI